MKKNASALIIAVVICAVFASCKKNDDNNASSTTTITVENVLDSRPLVESGTFVHNGTSPLIMPGDSVSFSFYAAKGEAISFATMYGWSNDLFFAPANPGILVYDASGNPIEGDVSAQVKLWDNGTRVNQTPGANVVHPGTAESVPQNISEVNGTDAQGNAYVPASSLMKVNLHYEGNSKFTLTIQNASGSTGNGRFWRSCSVSWFADTLVAMPVFTSAVYRRPDGSSVSTCEMASTGA